MLELSAREDVQVPVEDLFVRATRFGKFARQARSNGAKVRRLQPGHSDHGPRWEVHYPFGGTQRRFTLELVERRAPECLRFAIHSDSLAGELAVNLRALDPGRTGVEARLAVSPLTAKARILLHSMRLTRARMDRRFAERVRSLVARAAMEPVTDPGVE